MGEATKKNYCVFSRSFYCFRFHWK